MYKKIFFQFLSIAIILLLIIACNRGENKAFRVIRDRDLKKHDYINVSVKRFDVDLFAADPDNLQRDLKKLKNDYLIFLDTDLDDKRNLLEMEAYLDDISVRTLHDATMEKYPDITFLEVQLTDAFRRIKHLFPDFVDPQVYTYVSGGNFEFPIRYVDNNLIIALDMYLGSDYPVYSMWGIPRFISYRMRRENIVVDCMKEIASSYLDKYETKNNSLLDRMIFQGKILYFVDLTLPNIHDSIKIHYTASQLGWAEAYQGNVWSFFIEQDILYSTNLRTVNRFLNDAPFTSTFSRNSPPRIGHYIGWQIVRHFMMNNPEFKIEDLFKEINSAKILQLSKYKPKTK